MTTPTVVLVHGAFADASSWSGVIAELQAQDIPVIAPPNELRSLATDAAYLASVISQIDGPVVLVGHSYGGALIGIAGTADNVVGLVYVTAYVLDEGESLGELQGRFAATPLVANLKQWTYPAADGTTADEVTVVEDAFPSIFAADVSPEITKVLAVTQRPLTAAAFGEPATAAAWRTKPSWSLVARADQAINPEVQRFGAERAGAKVTEVEGASHGVIVSQPELVADLIRQAVRATG